jgi:hypothetical protein
MVNSGETYGVSVVRVGSGLTFAILGVACIGVSVGDASPIGAISPGTVEGGVTRGVVLLTSVIGAVVSVISAAFMAPGISGMGAGVDTIGAIIGDFVTTSGVIVSTVGIGVTVGVLVDVDPIVSVWTDSASSEGLAVGVTLPTDGSLGSSDISTSLGIVGIVSRAASVGDCPMVDVGPDCVGASSGMYSWTCRTTCSVV